MEHLFVSEVVQRKKIYFEYCDRLAEFISNKFSYEKSILSLNWLLFYIFLSIILNPFFTTFEDIKINIFLDLFGLIMPLFFIKRISKLSFYYFLSFFSLILFQLLFLVYSTKNFNVIFQSRMTMYFICQIFLFYSILSQISHKYIISTIKVVNYFVFFIIIVLFFDFFIADVFISKSYIKEYIVDYRGDLYTYFTKIFNGSSPNGLILGPQHSSIISLIACFYLIPIFKDDFKDKVRLFIYFPCCFFMFILTMTTTSLICLVMFLGFCSFSAKGTIFFNKYFRAFSLLSIGMLALSWEFLIYIKVGKIYDASFIQYYIDVFTSPIYNIIRHSSISNILLGSGSYPEVWYKSKELVDINADFGYGMWILSDGIIVVFVLTIFFFYTLYTYLKNPLFFIEKNESRKYLDIIISPIIFCFFVFTSIIHYQTIFQIGIKQLFCFYFSVILYFMFHRKKLINNSESNLFKNKNSV